MVGRNLLPLLKDNGHEVIALTRNTDTAGVRLPIACQIVHWDPTTHTPLPDFPENINAVIHLCGEGIADGRWTRKRKQAIYDSRVLSTRNLLNLFRKSKSLPKVWISASAIGYYKNSSHPALEETSPPGNGFLANVCKDWETETFKADALGIRTVALRLGIILGPDGGITAKMLPPFRMGLGGPLGKGDSWMSWIHVRDVAGLILTALENSSYQGPINAVSPHPVKNSEFTRILAGILKRSAFFSIPTFVLKFIFGEMSQLLLVSQNVSAQKSIGLGYKFVYPKLKTALKVICDQAGHKLVTEQWVPQPVDKVFEFFFRPEKLRNSDSQFSTFQNCKSFSSQGPRRNHRGLPVETALCSPALAVPNYRLGSRQTVFRSANSRAFYFLASYS